MGEADQKTNEEITFDKGPSVYKIEDLFIWWFVVLGCVFAY